MTNRRHRLFDDELARTLLGNCIRECRERWPRFWEHTIEVEEDFERHFDYVHYNPVKHGYVRCPHQWPHSSFHRWVKAGVYPWHWACWEEGRQSLTFEDIEASVGE